MKSVLFAALWVALPVTSMGQAAFRFYVFDETKKDSVRYEYVQDITIYLQGETTPPLAIEFCELLENPSAFNGKRVRISGFYHLEFEASSFVGSKEDLENYDRAIWLNCPSTFADSRHIDRAKKRRITVEGTFEIGPGGHMRLWLGELSRITYLKNMPENESSQVSRPKRPRLVGLRHPRRSTPPSAPRNTNSRK